LEFSKGGEEDQEKIKDNIVETTDAQKKPKTPGRRLVTSRGNPSRTKEPNGSKVFAGGPIILSGEQSSPGKKKSLLETSPKAAAGDQKEVRGIYKASRPGRKRRFFLSRADEKDTSEQEGGGSITAIDDEVRGKALVFSREGNLS